MKKTLFISSLLFLIAGWGVKPLSTIANAQTLLVSEQPATNSTQTPRAVQPQVELLNAGSQPRQQLRLTPTVNAKETATMTLNMNLGMSIANNPMPTVKLPGIVMTMETLVNKVDSNGDIHAQFKYTDADVVPDKAVPQAVINSVRTNIKKLIGTNGSFIIDNRGQSKGSSFGLPQQLDGSTKKMIEQISNSLNQISSPVPSEAVGIGAKWRHSASLNLSGMNLIQTTTYQLVDLKDNVATIKVNVQQHADPQKLTLAGLPANANLTLKSYNSQGQGQVKMQLNRMMPIQSTVSIRSNTDTNMSMPATSGTNAAKVETVPMKMDLLMDLSLESK